MAMVCHKEESIGDGVSWESSMGEENKHFSECLQMLHETLATTI
jgi:hypothetical protein